VGREQRVLLIFVSNSVCILAANHGGKYQYRICLDGSDTEECFKKNILKNDKGQTWLEVDDKKGVGTKFTEKIKIPDDLTCERCTLSFRWDGLHESVIFASCSDIQIHRKGPSPPGPSPTPPPPGPAPSGGFEKHDSAYCGTTGTDATRVSSKTGITGDDCEKQCVADNKCSCYDHKDSGEECRLYHGHPKVVASADGYKAYTRNVKSEWTNTTAVFSE
jgi:hypothetical protein